MIRGGIINKTVIALEERLSQLVPYNTRRIIALMEIVREEQKHSKDERFKAFRREIEKIRKKNGLTKKHAKIAKLIAIGSDQSKKLEELTPEQKEGIHTYLARIIIRLYLYCKKYRKNVSQDDLEELFRKKKNGKEESQEVKKAKSLKHFCKEEGRY